MTSSLLPNSIRAKFKDCKVRDQIPLIAGLKLTSFVSRVKRSTPRLLRFRYVLLGVCAFGTILSALLGKESSRKLPRDNKCGIIWSYQGGVADSQWKYFGVCFDTCAGLTATSLTLSRRGAVEHCLENLSHNPQALSNATRLNNNLHFGLRGRQEHTMMLLGDIELQKTLYGEEYLAFTERLTNTRSGVSNDPRAYIPNMFTQPGTGFGRLFELLGTVTKIVCALGTESSVTSSCMGFGVLHELPGTVTKIARGLGTESSGSLPRGNKCGVSWSDQGQWMNFQWKYFGVCFDSCAGLAAATVTKSKGGGEEPCLEILSRKRRERHSSRQTEL